jgi:endonuclease/exonuclease/phosphatase (EEP) superfamily protein YafD
MRRFLRFVYWVGLITGAGVTLYGLVAPIAPRFDLTNHFRPFTLLGCLGLLAVGVMAFRPRWPGAAIGLTALNLALALPAPAMTAGSASSEGKRIKVLSLNLWIAKDYDAVARVIEREDPDLVMLQEVRDHHVAELFPRLTQRFPHVVKNRYDVALLARTPLTAVQQYAESSSTPSLITALWTSPAGMTYRVGSVHLAWPFHPDAQLRHADWIAQTAQQESAPMILAGDFNLTPWSYMLNRLTYTSGLRRQGLIGFSWPSRQTSNGPLLLPAVLIDNVLTSPGISGSGFRVLEDVGSDHRPISVELQHR